MWSKDHIAQVVIRGNNKQVFAKYNQEQNDCSESLLLVFQFFFLEVECWLFLAYLKSKVSEAGNGTNLILFSYYGKRVLLSDKVEQDVHKSSKLKKPETQEEIY
ncbi:hypothetical protein PRUPE_8G040100 [Prunus persica]|uniref:Uncharacterized protein n=1 Tax=Prunus persica TaxID=3760 RepID=M5W081_PRUPE|nr:hypothetical protein PRUPE_8G040100 [Prunus persica]